MKIVINEKTLIRLMDQFLNEQPQSDDNMNRIVEFLKSKGYEQTESNESMVVLNKNLSPKKEVAITIFVNNDKLMVYYIDQSKKKNKVIEKNLQTSIDLKELENELKSIEMKYGKVAKTVKLTETQLIDIIKKTFKEQSVTNNKS